jgi:hypothetical protein
MTYTTSQSRTMYHVFIRQPFDAFGQVGNGWESGCEVNSSGILPVFAISLSFYFDGITMDFQASKS